ncbi:MAG TPA: glycosyl transferase family protein, partial [Trinickia sp.]|nr:glycosyl transferase family protein [Trinickia sp.]
ALSTESLADALAEQAELPRVSLSNIVSGRFKAALATELQLAYRAVPFSTADDGTLNVAVGSPLTEDERQTVKRAAGCNVAYFVASDAEITAELARHARFSEGERGAGGAYALRVAQAVKPGE